MPHGGAAPTSDCVRPLLRVAYRRMTAGDEAAAFPALSLLIESGRLKSACRALVEYGEAYGGTAEFWALVRVAAATLGLKKLCRRIDRRLDDD